MELEETDRSKKAQIDDMGREISKLTEERNILLVGQLAFQIEELIIEEVIDKNSDNLDHSVFHLHEMESIF